MNGRESNTPTMMRIAARSPRSYSAGPGPRYDLWVQGCTLRCWGCFNRHMQDPNGGSEVSIQELAEEIAQTSGIEGLSVSGGEPFQQAAAALVLVRQVRALNPALSMLAYSGYTYEELVSSPDACRVLLLHELDYLIDGRYVAELHLSDHNQWRGSANQRFLCLSDRARAANPHAGGPQVSVRMGLAGLEISGFPSNDLLRRVRKALRSLGFEVSQDE